MPFFLRMQVGVRITVITERGTFEHNPLGPSPDPLMPAYRDPLGPSHIREPIGPPPISRGPSFIDSQNSVKLPFQDSGTPCYMGQADYEKGWGTSGIDVESQVYNRAKEPFKPVTILPGSQPKVGNFDPVFDVKLDQGSLRPPNDGHYTTMMDRKRDQFGTVNEVLQSPVIKPKYSLLSERDTEIGITKPKKNMLRCDPNDDPLGLKERIRKNNEGFFESKYNRNASVPNYNLPPISPAGQRTPKVKFDNGLWEMNVPDNNGRPSWLIGEKGSDTHTHIGEDFISIRNEKDRSRGIHWDTNDFSTDQQIEHGRRFSERFYPGTKIEMPFSVAKCMRDLYGDDS
jgi:hypothetical protein